MDKDLKSLFITLPQRGTPDNFPPYGAMAIITSLRGAGYKNTFLYNMDVLRPSREEAIDYILSFNPDILAISSPVSTGYENCKFFSLEIKRRLPDITVILGGNLAASAEIILRKTGVDFCVLGEGEKVCCQILDRYFPHKSKKDLHDIKGLAFLDDEKLVVTGYAEQLPKEAIFDVDWDIMDSIPVRHYFPRLGDLNQNTLPFRYFFHNYYDNPESIPVDRLNKTIGVISCSKGCVCRCTYCHRFVKGIRIIPPEIVIERIKELIARFDVGALAVSDECFGVNPQWLRRFCELIKPLNLLWKVGGMRVDSVTPEIIEMMKDAGCRTIIYGMESGSEKILEIMEKRVPLEENYNAVRWTLNAGVHTVVQLVLGMPGEAPETIKETMKFLSDLIKITPKKSQNPREISINFAQALPGTPLYEYARSIGKIGQTLEDEEQYLLTISDRDAADSTTTINFTGYPRLTLLSWPLLLISCVNYNYIKLFGLDHYFKWIFNGKLPPNLLSLVRTFMRTRRLGLFDRYPVAVYKARSLLWIVSLVRVARTEGLIKSLCLLKEFLLFHIKRPFKSKAFPWEYSSLRRIVEEDVDHPYWGSPEMVVLRKGR